ncbi:unnamed protein product [Ostreobium quekettii]|uniref:Uncharacterized protein n=1 Tax=Ostreobium quekettii TaxID=121088 RepID=A0A8S1INQ7_9CHLO|nr:unnamed protein product [Ostreobium quekettii]
MFAGYTADAVNCCALQRTLCAGDLGMMVPFLTLYMVLWKSMQSCSAPHCYFCLLYFHREAVYWQVAELLRCYQLDMNAFRGNTQHTSVVLELQISHSRFRFEPLWL